MASSARGIAVGAMVALSGLSAAAQDYPSKSVKINVPFAAGGPVAG